MKKEPNIIINIGGSHPAKSIVAGVIANALEKLNVTSVNHLDYEDSTFSEMRRAISESSVNNLSSASVVIIEWDEDDDRQIFTEVEPIEKTSPNE